MHPTEIAQSHNSAHAQNNITNALRNSLLFLEQITDTNFKWVKAHKGHPLNELADVIDFNSSAKFTKPDHNLLEGLHK